jgi:hypothetical protein
MVLCPNCGAILNYLKDDNLWMCPDMECGEVYAEYELDFEKDYF